MWETAAQRRLIRAAFETKGIDTIRGTIWNIGRLERKENGAMAAQAGRHCSASTATHLRDPLLAPSALKPRHALWQ